MLGPRLSGNQAWEQPGSCPYRLPCRGLWAHAPLTPALPLCRLCMLLLVCAAQAWLMWRFIHSQLRHWREYWNEQSAKRRVPAAPRLPARLIKRESGE